MHAFRRYKRYSIAKNMDLVNIVESFVRKVKFLAKDAVRRSKNDAVIWHTKERVMAICDAFPTKVVDFVGQVMFKYREPIIAFSDDFFKTHSADSLRGNVTMDNYHDEDFNYIFSQIKVIYHGLTKEEKETYKQIMHSMLD